VYDVSINYHKRYDGSAIPAVGPFSMPIPLLDVGPFYMPISILLTNNSIEKKSHAARTFQ
jgi:hypothetical protein